MATGELEPDRVIYTAVGCENCNQGYSGRTAIFELLTIDDTVKDLIMDETNVTAMEKKFHPFLIGNYAHLP